MLFKQNSSVYFFFGLVVLNILGCHQTTKDIFRSSYSKKNYYKLSGVSFDRTKSSEISGVSVKNGKREFIICYTDTMVWKHDYKSAQNKRKPIILIATTGNDFTIPFDSTEVEIFKVIDSAIENNIGISYPISQRRYKGYVKSLRN